MNLTAKFVAGVRVRTRTTFFDTTTRGLALRVSPSGSATWHLVYRLDGKASRWLRLGDAASMSLNDARKLAARHRKTIDADRLDPVEQLRAEADAARVREADTFRFADFVPVYESVVTKKKATAADDMQKIRRWLLPAWGPLPLRSITRRHVHEVLDTVIGAGLTTGANRVQSVISRLFSVAVDRGLVDAHPATRMEKRVTETPRDRKLTDNEIRALWAGLDAHPGRAADAVRLRLLLGQRGHQIAAMRWADLDLEAGRWDVPAADMKKRRPHVVPLGASTVEILRRRRKEVAEDEPRVFPFLTLLSDDYRALAVLHGGAFEWRDLRRTMATRLRRDLHVDTETIGLILSHRQRRGVTIDHYQQHDNFGEKKMAIDAWDRELCRILADEPKRRADVVVMAGRR